MNSHHLATQCIVDLLPERAEVCFVLKAAFSQTECDKLLFKASQAGFRPANEKYPDSYRNNERFQVDNAFLAQHLFEKVCISIPSKLETKKKSYSIIRLNERLRYCRYTTGQSFSIHQDGVYHPTNGEESVLTFLLYLNNSCDYEGGETAFFDDRFGENKLTEFSGCAGDVIIFDHKLWHSGQPVTKNNKYILRSDFIYKVTAQKMLNQDHHDGYIWKLINMPGNRFASASRDKSIKIWNESMAIEQTLTSHENSVFDMANIDKWLFAVSRDGFLSIWQEGSQGYELVEKVNTEHHSALSVCVCDNRVITCGADGYVNKWTKSGKMINRTQVAEGWVWKVLPVSEHRLLVCTSKGKVKLLDKTNLKVVALEQINSAVRCAVTDEQFIYVGDESGCIYQLDIFSLDIIDCWPIHKGIIRDVTVMGPKIISCGEDGKVMCLDLGTKDLTNIHSDNNFVTSLCWANDRKLLSSSYTGRIESHDLHS